MISKRITKDYGMSDYYDYFKNNYSQNISRAMYNKVVSEIMENIVETMLNNELDVLTLPKLQFHISILKYKGKARIDNGKLINSTPVDWKTTNELWEQNPEMKEKKIRVRYVNNHSSKWVFRIKMRKYASTFRNKKYYNFKACRSFQRALAKRIKNPNMEQFDAYKMF